MEKIIFEDASLTSQAKVTIDGVDHLVTEAEYSGGTDLNANTFNQLQDNVENAIEESKLEEYSTSEQRIGTYLGKPLYRKVIQSAETIEGGATITVPHNISDLSKVIKTEASLFWDNKNYPFPVVYDNYTKQVVINYIDNTNIYIKSFGERWSTHKIDITLEYTKTTD